MKRFRFHPNALRIIAGKTYKQARKILKEFGCTKSEQSQLIRALKEQRYNNSAVTNQKNMIYNNTVSTSRNDHAAGKREGQDDVIIRLHELLEEYSIDESVTDEGLRALRKMLGQICSEFPAQTNEE